MKEPVSVTIPDAVAELAVSSGDAGLDRINEILIDSLQRGHLYAVRDTDHVLRFCVTPSGKDYIDRILG